MHRVIAAAAALAGLSMLTGTAFASFYQQSGDERIWYMSGDEYCHVTSQAQLRRLGGAGKVKQVKLSDNIFAGREDRGECAWPQGFYQRMGDDRIFMIRDEEICHVQSPDQLKALGGRGDVLSIPADAEIRTGLSDIGECRWP